MDEHVHKWECLKDSKDKLACAKENCDLVTTIDVLLANTKTEAAKAEKVNLLSKQLFARELKKSASDEAYAWVIENAPQIRQESLF